MSNLDYSTNIKESELWNLNYSLASYICPRLKMFKQRQIGYPNNFKDVKEWEAALDKMILAFETMIKQINTNQRTEDENKLILEGLILFSENLQNLWY